MHTYAWIAPAATVGLYLMSDAHLARRVSGPVEKLELLIPEVLCSNPMCSNPMSDAFWLRRVSGLVETLRALNLEVMSSNQAECNRVFFFVNYKLKHYVLLETNTFSGWGTQLLDSLVCRVEMQEPRVHLSRWVRAPGKLASFWHDFVYNYTVHHTI